MILPGQQVPHDLLSTLKPGQLFPPQEDVHLLVHLFVPSHVLLHDPHVHELHPPLTTQ